MHEEDGTNKNRFLTVKKPKYQSPEPKQQGVSGYHGNYQHFQQLSFLYTLQRQT